MFWMLHSAWALASGAAIAYLSHERYHLVGWVALALALTWASTLYFGRSVAAVNVANRETPERRDQAGDNRAADVSTADAPPTLAHEVTSYVTRVMYQETLFFLIPFYAYSTVALSPNVMFLALLGVLAVFSCIDIPFDRWLRTKPVFGFAFFAVVAFAALNLLLPLTFGLRVRYATPLSSLVAIAVAAPLAIRSAGRGVYARRKLATASLLLLVITLGFPVFIPPVPLRLLNATFAPTIDRETLTLADPLPAITTPASVGTTLVVLVHIFAPTNLPASVKLVWKRDGVILRTSRDMDIVAHTTGYRTWDSWRPPTGAAPPGQYEVVLQTVSGRVIGEAKLTIRE
jgi:hypothetical protein